MPTPARRAPPGTPTAPGAMLSACAWRESPAGPPPVVAALRAFCGGWLGIGRIVVGMARQSYDLQLTRYGEEGWRATFYPAGRGHSVTSAVGSAWEREPWTAVQRAAWESLRKGEADQAVASPAVL
jgi:hypothetical protein